METNKQNKPGSGFTFYILTFMVALLFELYWILTRPYDYFMLIGIGIIVVITGYLSLDSYTKAKTAEMEERKQQNETMIKAQKAIYLATKKNAVEAEKTREQNIKTLEIIMASMVNSQKELVNVITTKSDEIATKQIAMNDSTADVSELVDKLTKSNDKLAKQVQDAMTINELVKANAELVKSVQTMFEGQASAAAAFSEPEVEKETVSEPVVEEVEEDFVDDSGDYNTIEVDNIEDIINPEPIMAETEDFSSISTEEFNIDEMLDNLSSITNDDDIPESISVDTLGDIDINNITNETLTNDINAAQMEEAQNLEDMTVAEDITEELDTEMSSAQTVSDPNAPLTEEEIAALFAGL